MSLNVSKPGFVWTFTAIDWVVNIHYKELSALGIGFYRAIYPRFLNLTFKNMYSRTFIYLVKKRAVPEKIESGTFSPKSSVYNQVLTEYSPFDLAPFLEN